MLQLADNAVKHTDPGDTIAIGSSLDGDMLRLWVRDTGPGVPEHHRWVAPTLGQDNDEVLGGRLGLSTDELTALRAEKVIGESLG